MSPFHSSLLLIAACSAGCASSREDPKADGEKDASVGSDSGSTIDCRLSGELAWWSFQDEPGNQASTAAGFSVPGVTASPVQRGAGLYPAIGVDSINSSGWPTGPYIDATKYYTFSLTPPAGCMLAIATIDIDIRTAGLGPTGAIVGTSLDAFTQKTLVYTDAGGGYTLLTAPTTNAVEVRVSGYTAGSAAGTLQLATKLRIYGTLQ